MAEELEAFDAPLRGHRTLIIGSTDDWLARLTLLESESLYKGRSILIIQDTPNPILLKRKWDLIVRVKENFELQMLATYVANAPKPVRILWASDTGEIPRALWSKWVKQDVSLIGVSELGSLQGIRSCEWETIMFPLKCPETILERVLSARGSGIAGLVTRIKSHMADLESSQAALAWTNIDSDSRGNLYWYDPSEGRRSENLYTKKEASQLLDSLSRWVQGC